MDTPAIGSRWVRKVPQTLGDSHHGYEVTAITNIAHSHPGHPPQVVYRGDNGHWWSLPLAEWPGSLKPEVKS